MNQVKALQILNSTIELKNKIESKIDSELYRNKDKEKRELIVLRDQLDATIETLNEYIDSKEKLNGK